MVVTPWPRLSTISDEVERDQRLVLDDEDVGGGLSVEFGNGVLEQPSDLALAVAGDLRHIPLVEALERREQENLATLGRHGGQPLLGGPLVALR